MSKSIKIFSIILISCIFILLSAYSIVFAKTSSVSQGNLSNTSNSNSEIDSIDKSSLKSMVFNVSDTNKTYRVYMTDSQFDNFKVNGLIPKDVNDIDNYLKSTYIIEEIEK